jgi:biotin carboxyl carrier protein
MTEPKLNSDKSEPKRRMSTKQRLLFFLVAWLIVLMPFLFWWNTWFGRNLSDKDLNTYLHDERKPRHIQHALVQLGERMTRHDSSVAGWYPEIVRLATHPVEEVRNTDAWVMGQDTSGAGFHEALTQMLQDSSTMVRGNAALSLVRFGDASGRPQILALLEPATVTAPQDGKVVDASTVGTSIHEGGLVAKLQQGDKSIDVRSPIAGRIRSLSTQVGQTLASGTTLAIVDPGTEQVWEALRGLYFVGQLEDLPVVTRYERELPDIPDHIRQQAAETDKAIRERANKPASGQ